MISAYSSSSPSGEARPFSSGCGHKTLDIRFPSLKEESDPLYFGGYPGYPPLDGQLDEIRISNVQRYDRDFSPPRGPFKADLHTVALYHFDRGRILEDASGNGYTLRFFSFPLRLRGKLATTWAVVKRQW